MKTIGLMGLMGLMLCGCDSEAERRSREMDAKFERIDESLKRSEAMLKKQDKEMADWLQARLEEKNLESRRMMDELEKTDIFSPDMERRMRRLKQNLDEASVMLDQRDKLDARARKRR